MKFVELNTVSTVFRPGRLLITDGHRVYDVLEPNIKFTYRTHYVVETRFKPASRETFLTALAALEAKLVEQQCLIINVQSSMPPAPKPGDFSVGDQVFTNNGLHISSPYVVKLLTPKYAILDGYGGAGVFGRNVLPGWSRIENSYLLALRKDLIRKPEYER